MLQQTIIFIVCVLVGGGVLYVQILGRIGLESKVDQKVKDELDKRQLELVEIVRPDGTGPFPFIEISFLTTRGLQDRYYYRQVTYLDHNNKKRESWVKIRGVAGFFFVLEWRPDLGTSKKARS